VYILEFDSASFASLEAVILAYILVANEADSAENSIADCDTLL